MSAPPDGPLDVVLVEGWYGGSHRAWADGLTASSRHRFHLVTLPDRLWRWRLRAGAVVLADRVVELVRTGLRPDVVVVSSLVDAASLVGLARREVADTPLVVYLHENQLTHPPDPGRRPDEGLALAEWRSLVAADEVWFNSAFHHDELLGALPELLDREPPEESQAHLVADVARRSRVVPLGGTTQRLVAAVRPARSGPPVVVMNQRIAHDKDPDVALAALVEVAARGIDFEVVVTGEGIDRAPDAVRRPLAALGDRVRSAEHLARDAYEAALLGADVVVSAARHEFFGVAVLEAVAAGAVPVLPWRLSYPEVIPAAFHDDVLYRDGRLVDALCRVLTDIDGVRSRTSGLRAAMAAHDWRRVAPTWDERLAAAAAAHGTGR